MFFNQFNKYQAMDLPGFYSEASLISSQQKYKTDTFLYEPITVMPQLQCKSACVIERKGCISECGGNTRCIEICNDAAWRCIVDCGRH